MGGWGEVLPEHAGMPIGEEYGGATYFLLETHYDNPGLEAGILDSSGMRFHYTDVLRRYDTGILLVGSDAGLQIPIPPHQERHEHVGRCNSQCTEAVIMH